MAWLTAGEIPTATKLNAGTIAGIATQAGQIFVSTGVNTVAARLPTEDRVNTSETTTSTSWTNLTTAGPSVTVTTGTKALVVVGCLVTNNTTGSQSSMGYDVSGASSISEDYATAFILDQNDTADRISACRVSLLTSLTAGSNTFRARYVVNGGTGTFSNRTLMVVPLS